MDPLSITASTVALARLCMKVSTTVYEFTTDTRDVDTNVQNLYRGLRSLSQVLTNVSTAWSENPLVAVAQTGPDGNLWICVKDNVGNCGVVLKKLEAVLDKVSAENAVGKGFMRRPVKQIRLNLNKKDIQGFGSEVQTYERALAIAFNAINACAAMRRDHTDAEVTKRLETIEMGIQDLSQSLRHRQPSGVGASSEATKSLEQFLQAANTFKSSASTVVNGDTSTVRGGLTSQDGGSIFGDSLSDDRYEIIQSWIPPPSPLGTRGTSTAVGSTQQGGLNHQGSLPELMAVLETVTQMADQYRNSEQERNSSKDEQLRSLEMENKALEQRLEESHAAREFLAKSGENTREQFKEENRRLKHELDCMVKDFGTMSDDLKSQKVTIVTATTEREQLLCTIESLDIEKRDLKSKISGLEDQNRQQVALVVKQVEEQNRSLNEMVTLIEELKESPESIAQLQGLIDNLLLKLKSAEKNVDVEREEFKKRLSKRKWELDRELERAAALKELNLRLEEDLKEHESRVQKLDYDLGVEIGGKFALAARRAEESDEHNTQLRAECEAFGGLVEELERKLGIAEDRCISRGNAISNQKQIPKETECKLCQLASLQEQQSKLLLRREHTRRRRRSRSLSRPSERGGHIATG